MHPNKNTHACSHGHAYAQYLDHTVPTGCLPDRLLLHLITHPSSQGTGTCRREAAEAGPSSGSRALLVCATRADALRLASLLMRARETGASSSGTTGSEAMERVADLIDDWFVDLVARHGIALVVPAARAPGREGSRGQAGDMQLVFGLFERGLLSVMVTTLDSLTALSRPRSGKSGAMGPTHGYEREWGRWPSALALSVDRLVIDVGSLNKQTLKDDRRGGKGETTGRPMQTGGSQGPGGGGGNCASVGSLGDGGGGGSCAGDYDNRNCGDGGGSKMGDSVSGSVEYMIADSADVDPEACENHIARHADENLLSTHRRYQHLCQLFSWIFPASVETGKVGRTGMGCQIEADSAGVCQQQVDCSVVVSEGEEHVWKLLLQDSPFMTV